MIERALISSRCGSVKFDLPVPQTSGSSIKTPIKKNGDNPNEVLTDEDMRLSEKTNIEKVLQTTDWEIYGSEGAAELLGLKPTPSSLASKKWALRE